MMLTQLEYAPSGVDGRLGPLCNEIRFYGRSTGRARTCGYRPLHYVYFISSFMVLCIIFCFK